MVEIENAQYNQLPEFTFHGTFDYKAVRVYDGDTLHVAICAHGYIYRVNCRILQIDASEMPPSNSEAMQDYHVHAYKSRDRLVELVTNVDLEGARNSVNYIYGDTIGNTLPSFSDAELQKILDEQNTLVIVQGIIFEKLDNFGRYLVHIKSKDGRNVSRVLLNEGLAIPFDDQEPFHDPFE